jgi:MiaB-like tRNA modifying enzyme
MQSVFFKTFGCRTNQFDTQVMISKLGEFKLAMDEKKSDIVVVNSCTVTNGADVSVRSYINSIKRKNPNVKIILAGCGSHSKGVDLFNDQKVFGVIGHSKKEIINEMLKKEEPFYEIGDLSHIDSAIVEEFVGKSRAFIKIQEGCNFKCAYCIIPTVRGRARSHTQETVLEQISKLASNGFEEFILTGTNVGSYGKDRGSSIAKLLKKISKIQGVKRVRIGSLEPMQIDDEFKELLGEPWMARHLHIALQHSSDTMLELMNRRNRFATDLELFEDIASRGYALGTDFIVGHPGESSEIWKEAMRHIESLPLTHIHAFSYSKRDNTPSALMRPEVQGDITKNRHRELTEAVKAKNFDFRRSYSDNLEVLLEGRSDGLYYGYDQHFNRARIASNENLSGNWVLLNSVEVNRDGNYANY